MEKLDLYNDALLLLGLRQLASIDEDREPRHRLDGAYTRDGILYCLQLCKPQFATTTIKLATPTAGQTYAWDHALPIDSVALVGVFSDAKLQQPVTRYVRQSNKISCEYSSIWYRYVSGLPIFDVESYSPSFVRVVGAYLAQQTARRLAPDMYDSVSAEFELRVKTCIDIEGVVPGAGSDGDPYGTAPVGTLNSAWLPIYNDALLIMGLPEITSPTDDSARRTRLDRALSAGIVEAALEDTGWSFGLTSTQIYYDPSAEPAWGMQYALPKPNDLHRIHGVYTNPGLTQALKHYQDEGQYIFCDHPEIYLTFVTKTFLQNPSNWPMYFRRFIAATMAKDAAKSLGGDYDRSVEEYKDRKASAESTDVMNSPPRLIASGSWVKARHRGGYRGRP
jgi:hypothetical protein